MEKSFFVTLAVLLPLWLYLVSFSTSSSTVTWCCQWVQLFCSFYNGVDIGGQIPWGNIDFQVTVLKYLGSGVSDENFQRENLYVRPNYRYHPQLTVAVDDQQRFFISEPRHSITDTTHAEAKLIQFLNDTGQLSTIPYFNLTNSPCKEFSFQRLCQANLWLFGMYQPAVLKLCFSKIRVCNICQIFTIVFPIPHTHFKTSTSQV